MPARLGLTVLCVACLPGIARAQLTPSAKMALVSANQLGILEYCRDHGLAGADALAAERGAFKSGPSSNLSTVRVQELGRQGFSVSPESDQITIADLAAHQATTVPALCKDLADAALQFQAELRRAVRSQPASPAEPH